MTPPNSDAREVAARMCMTCGASLFTESVSLPLPLAQHILAALHAFESLPNEFAGKEWRMLATELRERMSK